MKAYEATYENDKEETTILLVGGDSFYQAARKAEAAELLDKYGDLLSLILTEKVIL